MPPVEGSSSGNNPDSSGDSGNVLTSVSAVTMPNSKSLIDPKGSYVVVAWDLDTTGRRLLDEICQIGGHYVSCKNEGSPVEMFSQYVMPYKNPNPGARRSFGIRVVNFGRYRMLKDMDTGKILKTKSEISALQDFIDWMKKIRTDLGKDGVILVCHEPTRKVLISLLLEALYKYNLVEEFKSVVKGFANGIHLVKKFGDLSKVTSLSLRSLCKTILNDTNPKTASASDRSQVLVRILQSLTPLTTTSKSEKKTSADESSSADSSSDAVLSIDETRVAQVAVTVESEEEDLKNLKNILSTQGTLRPVFETLLRQKRSIREQGVALRKQVAEAGVDYQALQLIYKEHNNENKDQLRSALSAKITSLEPSDLDTLVSLLDSHFDTTKNNLNEENSKKGGKNVNNNNKVEKKSSTEETSSNNQAELKGAHNNNTEANESEC